MNRYPLWKYLVIGVALLIGALYALPNIFGEAPAVQVSAAKPTVKVELATQARVEKILADASIPSTGMFFERTGNVGSVKVRFDSTDIQLRAKDLLQQKLNSDPNDPSFTVALNLLSNTPHWLSSINAMPMPLGLDLRGGVYFLLQVDMQGAVQKKVLAIAGDIRSQLREKNIRHQGIERGNESVTIQFGSTEEAEKAKALLTASQTDLIWQLSAQADGARLLGQF